MKNIQMKDSRINKLSNGKVKGVGFFEKISLKIIGFIDGKRGLPRENPSGDWISPHLDREVRSYDEFESRIWGHLQIEDEFQYAKLGELMDSIVHTKTLLDYAEEDLEKVIKNEKSEDNSRKYGESKLTEEQVAARRANERNKRLSPFRTRVSSLQTELSTKIDELSELRNRIIEDNNSTRMICNRVKDHLYQRMDVYWGAALWQHPDKAKMPAAPNMEVISRTENVYMEPHKLLMQKTELVIHTFTDVQKEVA